MLPDINLLLILSAAFVATVSPGPATLALAGTSMASGRVAGLALASGITSGSLVLSIAAALGLGTLMLANVWAFEFVRYFGAIYLMYLAYKSLRSALSTKDMAVKALAGSKRVLYVKGVALHMSNPKAILFIGSLYSIGLPPGASPTDLALVILAVVTQSFILFHAYALIFSSKAVTTLYLKLRRWFEGAFAVGFGLASVKILTAKIQSA